MAAIDRIVGGLEKKSRIITDDEKFSIATHEAGHATITWMIQYGNPLVKVTIVPRGRALGAAWYAPEERQIIPTQALLDTMCGLLAGQRLSVPPHCRRSLYRHRRILESVGRAAQHQDGC